MEVKKEDDPEPADNHQQDSRSTERDREQEVPAPAEQVKAEADKGGHNSRKRPYDDNRTYSYYEHREEKRYAYHKF